MSKGKRFQTKYSPEFKLSVIMDMRENHLSYREYLEEGAAGLMEERRGRKSTGRPRKQPLEKSVEEDLIAENQRLRERNEYLEAELAYLKKLDALVREREQRSGKKPKQ